MTNYQVYCCAINSPVLSATTTTTTTTQNPLLDIIFFVNEHPFHFQLKFYHHKANRMRFFPLLCTLAAIKNIQAQQIELSFSLLSILQIASPDKPKPTTYQSTLHNPVCFDRKIVVVGLVPTHSTPLGWKNSNHHRPEIWFPQTRNPYFYRKGGGKWKHSLLRFSTSRNDPVIVIK